MKLEKYYSIFFIKKWKPQQVLNVGIMPYVFFVPEAKLRDTKHTVGIISIWYFNKEHILNACSEASGIFPINNVHFLSWKMF